MNIKCCQLLIAEHRETERQLEHLEALLSNPGDWNHLQEVYIALEQDLKQHFALEEQALFLMLSPYRSMMLMEVEHDDLLTLQNAFEQTLVESVQQQSPAFRLHSNFQDFAARLRGHMREEEDGVFPLAEVVLEVEEKQRVLRGFNELQARFKNEAAALVRPTPGFKIQTTDIFTPLESTLAYQALYEREHSLVQHLWLKAGQSLAKHWSAQHQCLLVLSGEVFFETDTETNTQRILLTAGEQASIDSRLYFSLASQTDCHLLLYKTWPHPHYTKG